MHVRARSAGRTQPAGDQRVDDDRVADGHAGDRAADALHPTGVLMPRNVGQRKARRALRRVELALVDVQVGATHPGRTNPDDDVEGTGYFRVGDLLDHQVLVETVQPRCLHLSPSNVGPCWVNRDPGRPHARKNSPVARQVATFTSLPAAMSCSCRVRARASSAAAGGPPISLADGSCPAPSRSLSAVSTAARASYERNASRGVPPSAWYRTASGSASRSGCTPPSSSIEPASPTRRVSNSSADMPLPASASRSGRAALSSARGRSPWAAFLVSAGAPPRGRHGTGTPLARSHSFGPNASAAA